MYIILEYSTSVYFIGYTEEEVTAKTAAGGAWEGKTPVKCD